MWPQNVVLVVATILLSNVFASVDIDSKATVFDLHSIGTPTERLLRTHTTVEEDDEDRGLSGLDKIIAPLKASVSKITDAGKLRAWLINEKSVDDALSKLKLNEGVDEALSSPNLKILDKYVGMFNKKYPDKQVSLVEALTARYGEVDVAKALVSAKKAEKSKEIASKLQTQQLEGWLNSQKSVDDVFSILKIQEESVYALVSRKLETMEKYIELFNTKNSQHKTNLITTLKNGFGGDEKLAKLVWTAMQVPAIAVRVGKYEKMLFKRWMQKDYDPNGVLINVFKVDKNNLATAQEQSIVDAYKSFYDKAKARATS